MAEIAPASSSLEQVSSDEKQVAHARDGAVADGTVNEKSGGELGPVAPPVSEKKQSISDLFTIVRTSSVPTVQSNLLMRPV